MGRLRRPMITRMNGVAELQAAFRSQALSPVEAAEESLRRIEVLDSAIGAFVTVTPDVAMSAAAASEERWRRGAPVSPIDGIPFALKDLTPTAGVRTTYGSLQYADHVPDVDAAYWTRLRAAGAVLVGKTNTPEFGAIPSTENRLGPPTRNPWNRGMTAGGSSGGSAAALAGGMVGLAEGSDGGGSIRIPASCCGVVGIKPSRGRVSQGPLFGEAMSGLATSGPMGLSVADCLLMLHAMEGADAGDPYPRPAPAPWAPVTRVGVVTGSAHARVDEAVAGAVTAVARELEAIGVSVEAVDLPLAGFDEAFETVWAVGLASNPHPDLERADVPVRKQVERGRRITAVEYEHARVRLHRLARKLRVAMDPFDACLLPVLTTPPRPLGFAHAAGSGASTWSWLAYTYPFNATGQPSIALPAATSADGLPIGVQLVGRLGEDERVAHLAARWEAARGLPHPRPPGIDW